MNIECKIIGTITLGASEAIAFAIYLGSILGVVNDHHDTDSAPLSYQDLSMKHILLYMYVNVHGYIYKGSLYSTNVLFWRLLPSNQGC